MTSSVHLTTWVAWTGCWGVFTNKPTWAAAGGLVRAGPDAYFPPSRLGGRLGMGWKTPRRARSWPRKETDNWKGILKTSLLPGKGEALHNDIWGETASQVMIIATKNPQESLLNEINPESLLYSSMLKSPWELSDFSISEPKAPFQWLCFRKWNFNFYVTINSGAQATLIKGKTCLQFPSVLLLFNSVCSAKEMTFYLKYFRISGSNC